MKREETGSKNAVVIGELLLLQGLERRDFLSMLAQENWSFWILALSFFLFIFF